MSSGAEISSDDDLVSLVELCEEYVRLHTEVASVMSTGFLNIAIARKSVRISLPDDIRMDLEPNLVLQCAEDMSGYCVEKKEGEGSAMHMLCPLPPPALKKAQKEFVAAINYAVMLEQKARLLALRCGLSDQVEPPYEDGGLSD